MAKLRPTSPRRPKKPVTTDPPEHESVLKEIYGDPGQPTEGSKDSLKTIDQKSDRRTTRILLWVLGGLTLVVAASVAGFFFFNQEQHFNEQSVTLSMTPDENVPSGGETTLSFTVKNDEAVGIKSMRLSLVTPTGWTFKHSSPDPESEGSNSWQLGSVGAKSTKTFTMTGILVGEVGSVKTFNATLTYRPSNFNYDFTAEASGSVTIARSILELNVEAPSEIIPNANLALKVNYRNTSTESLNQVRIVAAYPEGFTPTTAKPEASENQNVWTFDQLITGQSGTIEIGGTQAGNKGSSVQFTFVAEMLSGNTYDKQVEASAVVLLSDAQLKLGLTVNKQSSDIVVEPEATLAYVLTYKNESDSELTDVILTAAFSGGAFEAGSFVDDDGAGVTNGSATWNKDRIPQLASLKPGASGTIRFSLAVPSNPAETAGETGASVRVEVKASVAGSETSAAKPLVVKVGTKAGLQVDPRYVKVDGTTVGTGPVPPVAGQTTSYWIFWRMTNTTNDLTDVRLTAKLPASVYWTGKNTSATAGSVAFDPASRTVTWTLNRLPAGVGTGSTLPASAAFEVSITPATGDVGTTPKLLEESTLEGKDAYTGATVTVKQAAVTTDLPNDKTGTGKGEVVAP